MLDTELQEWEEYDARLWDDTPFAAAAPPKKRSGASLQAPVSRLSDLEGPFMLGNPGEAASETEGPEHECSCGRSAGSVSTEAEGYGESERLEEVTPFGENEAPGCSAGCPEPSKAYLNTIRAKGIPQGMVNDRTEGDPSVNLSLQLFDYDVNEYRPLKPKHRDALTRLREFIVQRTVQTNEPIAVTITGLASRTGSRAYNDVLSCKRAECLADNLRQSLSFFRGVSDRVQINTSGEGFGRATCKGSDCEQDEWRSVLVQIHAPNNPPKPITPVDTGSDQYSIRCCSFHTENLLTGVLGDLLKNGLPSIPGNLRSKLLDGLKKGLNKLAAQLAKKLPKLGVLLKGLGELLDLFPAEVIRETGVFEIREQGKVNNRSTVLCYSGMGLRISVPTNLDDFLDQALGNVQGIPDGIKSQVKDAIKQLIPNAVKNLAQPIQSDTPGPFARFNLLHPRNMRVFEGSVQVGKGVWMPGQVNVEFDSPPWHRPDPVQRPHIKTPCPDTPCNDAGVQTTVGNGNGIEFFSITAGDLIAGSCVCAPASAGEFETEMETESLTFADGQESRLDESESYEIDPYASIRSALAPEHENLAADDVALILGRRPAALVLHHLLNSPATHQATLAILLGKGARRSVRVHGSDVSIPGYLRMMSRLCREVAEQSEAGLGPAPQSGVASEYENGASDAAQYADIVQQLRKELALRFNDPNDPGLLDRRKRLKLLFSRVPTSQAKTLSDRLGVRPTKDELSRTFHGTLAPATITELLTILNRIAASPGIPAVPVPPRAPAPAVPASVAPRAPLGAFGNFNFENIKNYRPSDYPLALAAQDDYAKVAYFLPSFKKIDLAVQSVSIALSQHGDALVFSMEKRAFSNLVEDSGFQMKAAEIAVGGASAELVFDVDVIGVLGLGLTLLEIFQGIENERMVGGTSPEAEEWRRKKKLQFVIGLMAEDIRRRTGGDTPTIAYQLAVAYNQFKPVFYNYTKYTTLEDNLSKFQGNIPTNVGPSMGVPPPGM